MAEGVATILPPVVKEGLLRTRERIQSLRPESTVGCPIRGFGSLESSTQLGRPPLVTATQLGRPPLVTATQLGWPAAMCCSVRLLLLFSCCAHVAASTCCIQLLSNVAMWMLPCACCCVLLGVTAAATSSVLLRNSAKLLPCSAATCCITVCCMLHAACCMLHAAVFFLSFSTHLNCGGLSGPSAILVMFRYVIDVPHTCSTHRMVSSFRRWLGRLWKGPERRSRSRSHMPAATCDHGSHWPVTRSIFPSLLLAHFPLCWPISLFAWPTTRSVGPFPLDLGEPWHLGETPFALNLGG
jgi:hypothetical protein